MKELKFSVPVDCGFSSIQQHKYIIINYNTINDAIVWFIIKVVQNQGEEMYCLINHFGLLFLQNVNIRVVFYYCIFKVAYLDIRRVKLFLETLASTFWEKK